MRFLIFLTILFVRLYKDEFSFNIFLQLPNDHNKANIPIVKKQSPTLLVNKAEIELWFAAILVYQKLTKR